jgi:CelD/BcsL family acetyltransferase involved in cellulose biosynthesis
MLIMEVGVGFQRVCRKLIRVTEVTDSASVRAQWEILFNRSPATPFQSPEWLLNWAAVFAAEGVWILAVHRGREMIGLAPMYFWTDPADARRQLTMLGNGISDHLDLIAAPGEELHVGKVIWAHVSQSAELWDTCDFRDLPASSALLMTHMPGVFAETIEPEEPCPVVTLPKHPEEIVDALSHRRRQHLRTQLRQLQKLGNVEFRTATSADLPACLTELIRLHGVRWGARGQAGALHEPAIVRFHRLAAGELLRRGLLRLDLLTLDGRAISAHYGMRSFRTGYSYIHGFDPEFTRFGPGSILLAHVLECAVREGCTRFDFLRGRESYKYIWGGIDQQKFRKRVCRDSRTEPIH